MVLNSLIGMLTLVAMCTVGAGAQAHEFWIDAEDYSVPSGAPVVASLRNGQEFAGSALSYVPPRTERFDMILNGEASTVPSQMGDNPAFDVSGLPDGLLVIVHETKDSMLTYTEWAKFVRFAEHKDATDILEEHVARGLPREGFGERYRRFAKALVAIGEGEGADMRVGLRTEIVALANPYTDDLSGGLPVQVWLEDAPKANAQVEMFDRGADGTVEITLHRTDAEGRAVLPVRAGHDYLLDSVEVLPSNDESATPAVWDSLWAALTFAVPEE